MPRLRLAPVPLRVCGCGKLLSHVPCPSCDIAVASWRGWHGVDERLVVVDADPAPFELQRWCKCPRCGRPTFSVADLIDHDEVVERFFEPADPVAPYLFGCLTQEGRNSIQDYKDRGGDPSVLKHTLTSEFNKIVKGADIYSALHFTPIIKRLLVKAWVAGRPFQKNHLARFNRLLLEEAFPDELAPTPPFDCYYPLNMNTIAASSCCASCKRSFKQDLPIEVAAFPSLEGDALLKIARELTTLHACPGCSQKLSPQWCPGCAPSIQAKNQLPSALTSVWLPSGLDAVPAELLAGKLAYEYDETNGDDPP